MRKLLVIDKCVFHGTAYKNMSPFVRQYNVVFPHALGVECVISEDESGKKSPKEPIKLLKKLDGLVKAGANIGHSPFAIFKEEKETKKAIPSIIDCQGTQVIRKETAKFEPEYIKEESKKAKKAFQPNINFCRDFATTYYANLVKKGFQKSFREEFKQNNTADRLKKWIHTVDKMRDKILQSQLPQISTYITDENDQWFSWQLLRVYCAWAIEWACKRNQSGSSIEDQDISNDFYDMEYIACLSKADGILTNDKNLVMPLAKAAFPDKDIFSELDEVPDEYICHWK